MTIEWIQAFAEQITGWDILIWGTVAIAVIGWLTKRFVPWLIGTAKGLVNLSQMVASVQGFPDFIVRTDATLDAQNEKIQGIHHETHQNDGSSIKDAVGRIEQSMIVTILPRLAELSENQSGIILPGLEQLTLDIEAFRMAETRTTVEVISNKG